MCIENTHFKCLKNYYRNIVTELSSKAFIRVLQMSLRENIK